MGGSWRSPIRTSTWERGGGYTRVVAPKAEPELDPIVLTIPLQLMAYHAAVSLGEDIDRPRNLAKSVTVE